MDDAIPSISTGAVGSRFVSQGDIDSAKAQRDEQWKAAYARLGQEPPPQPVEDVYDGRSLAEKLAANKAAKQEEWEEKTKLANQFRALEEDEVLFLDSIMDEQRQQELKVKQQDAEEVDAFKQAVAAKNTLAQKSALVNISPIPMAPSSTKSTSSSAKGKTPEVVAGSRKVAAKKALKGVVVKKRKAAVPSPTIDAKRKATTDGAAPVVQAEEREDPRKRRKVSESGP